MKVIATVLILLFSATSAAYPGDEGGGSSSGDEDSTLSGILMITVVVGVAVILVSDILSDNAQDSQDALAGINVTDATSDQTGVNWDQIAHDAEGDGIPVLAVAVFNIPSGRDLARYFTGLLAPGEEIHYTVYGPPLFLGSIPPAQAAATGFSAVNCNWFITGDSTGIQLFQKGQPEPVWFFAGQNPDSSSIRTASARFFEFASAQ